MSKERVSLPPVSEIAAHIKKKQFLPVYFIYGEDTYQINQTIEALEAAILPLVNQEFDRGVFYSKSSCEEVLDFALSYPIGGQSKLVIFKELELKPDKEKNILASYINSPSPFTYMIMSHAGKFTALGQEYSKALVANGYIFESKPLQQKNLQSWLIQRAAESGKTLSPSDAALLIDLSGDDRAILEMQLDKIFLYLKDEQVITTDIIMAQMVDTKKFLVFDLERAIEENNGPQAFRVAFTLLDAGEYPLTMIGYFNKLFTNLSRIPEQLQAGTPQADAARQLGVQPWTYPKLAALSKRYSPARYKIIAEALLEADLAVKTSVLDHKTIMTRLLSAIFPVNSR
jgi:DNA polymerase-3 subunit delta